MLKQLHLVLKLRCSLARPLPSTCIASGIPHAYQRHDLDHCRPRYMLPVLLALGPTRGSSYGRVLSFSAVILFKRMRQNMLHKAHQLGLSIRDIPWEIMTSS